MKELELKIADLLGTSPKINKSKNQSKHRAWQYSDGGWLSGPYKTDDLDEGVRWATLKATNGTGVVLSVERKKVNGGPDFDNQLTRDEVTVRGAFKMPNGSINIRAYVVECAWWGDTDSPYRTMHSYSYLWHVREVENKWDGIRPEEFDAIKALMDGPTPDLTPA